MTSIASPALAAALAFPAETLREERAAAAGNALPIVCLSHLRWDFVFQRPQHLMTRFARDRPVVYVEEPIEGEGRPRIDTRLACDNVTVAVPVIPGLHRMSETQRDDTLRQLLKQFIADWMVPLSGDPVYWFYTPMSASLVTDLDASLVVYDCMDELANFKNAPLALKLAEHELLERANLVFTGGHSLYEVKRQLHHDVHAFPSSVDTRHFAQARRIESEPEEMRGIPHPRIGFYGVIDERFDIELLGAMARLEPEWQWIVVGPVVKIDPATLPRAANIHYLGARDYADLPRHLASWDVAMMPFAINAATRFISPTKTPEYLAAGKPVVSTPITDVVSTYGDTGLVHIAADASSFVDAVRRALQDAGSPAFLHQIDTFLKDMSWDRTQSQMAELMRLRYQRRQRPDSAAARIGAKTVRQVA